MVSRARRDPDALPHVAGLQEAERRRLGAYYTSETLASKLLTWAVIDADTTVMDPSYGGCAFLRQAITRLRMLGTTSPASQVYGADIDESTALWRAHLVSRGVPPEHLHPGDFLLVDPGAELPVCGAVVGNPPYVRHHRLTPDQLAAYAHLRNMGGLTARANAWAYFVVHSLAFVGAGGRLAMLLPGAVLHDDGYAERVRAHVAERCERVLFVRVRDRLFPGVLEETVVLLATMAESAVATSTSSVDYAEVDGEEALSALLAAWPSSDPRAGNVAGAPLRRQKVGSLPTAVQQVLDRCRDVLRPLGDIADIRIGVVTGANRFFVRSAAGWPADPAARWVPIVSRSAWLDRPVWTDDDMSRLTADGTRTRLLAINSDRWSPRASGRLADEISRAEDEGLHTRSHTTRRRVWYDLGDITVPDAFLPYMGKSVGRPVLNRSAATSTNAVHHIRWRDAPPDTVALARIVSGWSTLWQLMGELEGRYYGGGVLKLEPGVARRLMVWDGDVHEPIAAAMLETALSASKAGDPVGVRQAADRLMGHVLQLTQDEAEHLSETTARLAHTRHRRASVSTGSGVPREEILGRDRLLPRAPR